jgi:hypothetical protein
MINLKLQFILLAFSIIVLYQFINMIRKYSLELKYALLWLLIGIVNLILVVFPSIIFYISNTLGIQEPVNALFLLGIISLFTILFSLTIALSRSSNKIKDMSQDIGILKQEVYMLQSKLDDKSDNEKS